MIALEALEGRLLLSAFPYYQLAAGLTASPEHDQRITISDYQTYLHRSPAPFENDWAVQGIDGLAANWTQEQLIARFVASPEYVDGLSSADWLHKIYKDVLFREPDAMGEGHWLDALTSRSALDIALAITTSPEREAVEITDLYATILKRGPDQTGMNAWLRAFTAGMRLEEIQARFIASPEFIDSSDVRMFTDRAFMVVLNRPANFYEVNAWLGFKDSMVNPPVNDPYPNRVHSETAAASIGQNVVVAYNDSDEQPRPIKFPVQLASYSYSGDGGKTWTEGHLPITPYGNVGDPCIVADPLHGKFYFLDLTDGGYFGAKQFGYLALYQSTDLGRTFQLVSVYRPPGAGLQDSPDKPALAIDGSTGQLYISWRHFALDPNSHARGILLISSTDGGHTWSQVVQISDLPDDQGVALAVGPDGTVYAAWFTTLDGKNVIEMRVSHDHGLTFAPASTVATLRGTGNNGDLGLDGFRTNGFPALAVSANGLYVAYDDLGLANGDRGDIYYTVSYDQDSIWTVPARLNQDATANDQWQPSIAVNSSRIAAFWSDRRDDPTNLLIGHWGRIGIIWSTGVVSWGAEVEATDVLSAPLHIDSGLIAPTYMDGDYDATIFLADGSALTAWGDNRGLSQDVRVFKQ